jgi:hypothetical protein
MTGSFYAGAMPASVEDDCLCCWQRDGTLNVPQFASRQLKNLSILVRQPLQSSRMISGLSYKTAFKSEL